MTDPATRTTHTSAQVADAVNWAADQVIARCRLAEGGALDAVNLAVNAALARLDDPAATLEQVAETEYDTTLDEVLGWVEGA